MSEVVEQRVGDRTSRASSTRTYFVRQRCCPVRIGVDKSFAKVIERVEVFPTAGGYFNPYPGYGNVFGGFVVLSVIQKCVAGVGDGR